MAEKLVWAMSEPDGSHHDATLENGFTVIQEENCR